MCGLVGVVHLPDGALADQEVDEEILRRMMSIIMHRGPDSSGVWRDGPVGLGHVRLSILDLSSHGHQPFVTDDGQGVLVYNGEVYNFRELRRRLEKEGVRFQSTSDTEVVLKAVHHWGPREAVPQFNGMFAFAYYDRRTNELWMARDRLGIKPLYWSKSGGVFLFGSEIKAMLRHPLLPCRPDMHALTAHLLTETIEGEWTIFEGVRSLRAGTMARLKGSRLDEFEYFDLLDALDPERFATASSLRNGDQVNCFGKVFEESVDRHMVSDAPLAAMCSGGVDSSLIAACAHAHRPDLTGYVADVKAGISEGPAAQRMADYLGIRLRRIEVGREEFLQLWPLTVWHNDQPNYFGQDAVFLAVAQACRTDGFKVLLTGEGADELFGGYSWQLDAWRTYRTRKWLDRLLPPIGPLTRLRRRLGAVEPASTRARSRMPFHSDRKLQWIVGHPTHRAVDPYHYTLATFAEQRFFRQERIFDRLGFIKPIEERAFVARSIEDTYSYLQLVLSRNDRLGMAASIESRFPFLDNALVDFALHLPFRAKRHGKQGKWTVRQFAARKLPEKMVFAPKIGFAVSDSLWTVGKELLRNGFLAEVLKWSPRSREMIVDRIAESTRLWYLVLSAELWGRMFFLGASPDELADELLRSSVIGAESGTS